MGDLRIDEAGPIWELVLNRPRKRNALSRALHAELIDALQRFDAAEDARVAILTGADPAFCAGMDLDELAQQGVTFAAAGENGHGDQQPVTFDHALRAVSKPVIAAVNGPAVTGGLEIVLGCDFVIASERAMFGDSHGRVGVFPGAGMTVLLAQAVGVRMARRMSLSGELIDAATALRAGLVTEVTPHSELLPRARALAAQIATTDPALVQALRHAYWRNGNLPVDEALREERADSAQRPASAARLAAGRADVLSERRIRQDGPQARQGSG